MKKSNLHALCEGAIMVALATVLGYLKFFELPQGGSVGIGMLPIFVFCCRWGWKQSFLASFACGLFQLLFDGAFALGPLSMLLDYLLAYGVLGVACFFRERSTARFCLGIFAACFLRFLMHFISGVTVFRIFAPTEIFGTVIANPYLYSAIYSGSYILLDAIACIALFWLLQKPLNAIFRKIDA